MAIEYTWEFPQLDSSVDNTVHTVHWRRVATETVGDDTYRAQAVGTIALPEPDVDAPDYIPYADLTHAQVVAWGEAEMADEVATLDANLAARIEEQKNPTTVKHENPFA